MLGLHEREVRVDQGWDKGGCTECLSRNVDQEKTEDGVRLRCNICGLRGRWLDGPKP